MKNRLIITVSDINGTKSYNIHQFFKKFFLFFIILIVTLLIGSFTLISYLNNQLDEIKESKEIQLRVLTQKEEELQSQNLFYSSQIENKMKNINELSSKLDEISTIIGLDENDTKKEITTKTLKTINQNKKLYTLNLIPNGKPIEQEAISSDFGYRINPITDANQYHRGIDIPAKIKTPIRATADGIVEFVETNDIGDYGRVVKIIHNYGFMTIFAHMEKSFVSVGDVVKKGQIIGLVGNSGRSTGPHLHYEIRFANKVLDPKNFISWDFKSYDSIFKLERKIEWESLIGLINEHYHNKYNNQ